MLKITPKDVLSFEIDRENVPGLFNRIRLRRSISKMCHEQTDEARQDLIDIMDRNPLSHEDVILGNETWQTWENEKNLFEDRVGMRKELLGLEIARFVLDNPSLGSLELRCQMIEESNNGEVQALLN